MPGATLQPGQRMGDESQAVATLGQLAPSSGTPRLRASRSYSVFADAATRDVALHAVVAGVAPALWLCIAVGGARIAP